jgi:coenzyme F420-dependent glucose-6-phosphate dehydrogenase
VRLGYALSGEEHPAQELIRYGARAEQAGADFLVATDHFHPWVGRQGHSPFVWATLGGLAQATSSVEVLTGVTCPTIRTHPAIVAHATATVATMLPGRFSLGVGAGEALNEHVVGEGWPPNDVRLEMLEEAIRVIRELLHGEEVNHRGEFYEVDRARLYTVPDRPPPIVVAAGGPRATKLAGRSGDGLFGLIPEPSVIEQFEQAGGRGCPRYGQIHVCWAESEQAARATAREWWPNAAVPGDLSWEIAVPAHFEALAEDVTEEQVAESVVCGPDPGPVLEQLSAFKRAGYDHAYLHQVGPDQEGFLDFFERELRPAL